MLSYTLMGMLLFIIPFTIIALHSIKGYLKDKKNSKKKHMCYAFSSFSIGFILDFIGFLMLSPDMSPAQEMIVLPILRSFDIFNMVGVFWVFVFLTDFIKNMKKYIPFVAVHLAITLILILVMPFGVNILEGTEFIEDRAPITSLAILSFWFLYWSIIAYQFWKSSRLMKNEVAMRRSQMMGAGAVFAILAYVATITAAALQSFAVNFSGEIFAAAAGITCYVGFIAPEWLRRRWEKINK